MIVYQILNWDEHFENHKSRTLDQCNKCFMPNKQHGMGLTHILSQPDGLAIYGAWCLTVGALSQQHKLRGGWLTDDGRETGRPWTPAAMALRWRSTPEAIERMLQVVTSNEVAWVVAHERPSAPEAPTKRPASALEHKEHKEQKEGKEQKDSSEPGKPASEPTVLTFPTVGKEKSWKLTADFLKELQDAYPTLDALAECKRARAWIISNSNKRKTAEGMRRFLNNWMSRANDCGGIWKDGNNGKQHGAGKTQSDKAEREFPENLKL